MTGGDGVDIQSSEPISLQMPVHCTLRRGGNLSERAAHTDRHTHTHIVTYTWVMGLCQKRPALSNPVSGTVLFQQELQMMSL